ncbi:protein MbtH [Sphaerisporangium krabiense]|uniref:MbtH protein n=1 Tax=Sphaerisporangium krabiense TaxID=763782 RepID=A0A7W8Z253_9ACTN|nr:MbtH family NRPS accessory protein [Sphaerisporangium krabiense]MBB5626039.1 MbtH protein [Sphaerisporangium krabiense]GII64844.1 protein MbtH [Sphaerisporangium krabiense]
MPENPFDHADGTFLVLVNQERQHSLWLPSVDVPAGWDVVHEGSRTDCLDYVERNWTDLRPASLARALDEAGRRPAE